MTKLISLACVCSLQAPTLLAGDPRQLGPVLRSATAAAGGLGVSLLDSWISFWHSTCPELLAATETSPAMDTSSSSSSSRHSSAAPVAVSLAYGMLTDNCRSHVRLLDLPSRLFYGGSTEGLCTCCCRGSTCLGGAVCPGSRARDEDEDEQAEAGLNLGNRQTKTPWERRDVTASVHAAEGEGVDRTLTKVSLCSSWMRAC